MSRIGTSDGRSSRKASPGQMLAARAGVRAVSPSAAGPGWQALSEYYTELAEVLTERMDVQVVAAPKAAGMSPSGPIPGRYIPSMARVDLDGGLLPVAPEKLDTSDPEHFRALAAMHGVFVHEIGHCEHSLWSPQPTSPNRASAMALLEEIRMEAQVVASRPSAPTWLRAAATKLIVDDLGSEFAPEGSAPPPMMIPPAQLASAATLTLGRVIAGSLLPEDVEGLVPLFLDGLGEETLTGLGELWEDVVKIGDTDYDALSAAADRFNELLAQDPEGGKGESGEGGSGSAGGGSADGGGESGESSDSDEGEPPAGGRAISREEFDEAMKERAEAIAEAAAAEAEAAEEAAPGEGLGSEMSKRIAEAISDALGDPTAGGTAGDASGEASSAPDSLRAGGRGTGPGAGIPVRWSLRPPTLEESASRRRLAAMLRKARWRDRVTVATPSELPPGRLRMRSALTRSAEISMGRLSKEKPWSKKKRTWLESPRLRVGVLVDVSGSMGPYQEALSSSAWVLASAVADAEGRAEVVAFGDDAVVVARAGEQPKKVLDFIAEAATEKIAKALRVIDRDLELMDGTQGPRLLIIVSDGVWVEWGESDVADRHLERLQAAGVQVMLVGIRQEPTEHPADNRVVLVTPDDLVPLVGEASRRALAAARV